MYSFHINVTPDEANDPRLSENDFKIEIDEEMADNRPKTKADQVPDSCEPGGWGSLDTGESWTPPVSEHEEQPAMTPSNGPVPNTIIVEETEPMGCPEPASEEPCYPKVEAVMPPDSEKFAEEEEDDKSGRPDDEGSNGGKNPDKEAEARHEELKSMLDALFAKVEEFQTTIERQQDIIRKQKRELEDYQKDVLAKAKEPILLDLTDIRDSIEMALEDDDRNPDHLSLKESLESIRKLAVSVLENHRVKQVKEAIDHPTSVSPRQNVVARESSSDPERFEIGGQQVDFFYETERPGYVMETEDINGNPREIILRPESIVRVVYAASKV